MQSLTSIIDEEIAASTLDIPAGMLAHAVRFVRSAIGRAMRRSDAVDYLFALARVPKLFRGLVRPYVERAVAAAADWVDPATPDPKP